MNFAFYKVSKVTRDDDGGLEIQAEKVGDDTSVIQDMEQQVAHADMMAERLANQLNQRVLVATFDPEAPEAFSPVFFVRPGVLVYGHCE
jgi:hypothetical protein